MILKHGVDRHHAQPGVGFPHDPDQFLPEIGIAPVIVVDHLPADRAVGVAGVEVFFDVAAGGHGLQQIMDTVPGHAVQFRQRMQRKPVLLRIVEQQRGQDIQRFFQ